ncbi:MAG: glycosyltransferase [Phycisphaerales bacterium]|nr:glycosyltransferase [Phycisphaerales bacterium]
MFSVIIPAHNEAPIIGRTLQAVQVACDAAAAQFNMSYEIILVADACDDGTNTIAENAGVRVVPVDLRRISAVRNAGAATASGEYLVFVDADTVVPPETLIAAIAAMQGGAAGGGAYIYFDRPIPLLARMLEPIAGLLYRLCRWASGCFTFVRRDVFDAIGGYDEELAAAEELFLSKAIKRQGRLVVLRERTITSGRKLRTYSIPELFGVLFRVLRHPGKSLREPERLGILYDEHRPDPRERDTDNQ